jgi:two-component system phosphate regulon response regulator OmpR
MDDRPHILVVDDDRRLRELLTRYLTEQGFRVSSGENAADARRKMSALTFDLLVVDIMMPGEDGLTFTQSQRRDSEVPILLLTAMGESEDRIRGLERGADDYLSKPFEPRELVLRINAILRRQPTVRDAPLPSAISFGGFSFDPARGELSRSGERVRLTTAEAQLLRALARRPGTPISRDALCAASGAQPTMRTVDVQVARLRRKIEPNPKYPRYLQTVRGTGYVLVAD